MALFTTLASLSQTPASNAADGTVDAPSTLAQQLDLLASFIAQLRDFNGFNGQLPALNGGWATNNQGWVAAGVTVAPTSGVFSNATGTIRYLKVGHTVIFSAIVTIVANGTGAGGVVITLPWAAQTEQAFAGRESQTTGFGMTATVAAGSTSLTIFKYDGTYPGGNNYRIALNGVIEVTA